MYIMTMFLKIYHDKCLLRINIKTIIHIKLQQIKHPYHLDTITRQDQHIPQVFSCSPLDLGAQFHCQEIRKFEVILFCPLDNFEFVFIYWRETTCTMNSYPLSHCNDFHLKLKWVQEFRFTWLKILHQDFWPNYDRLEEIHFSNNKIWTWRNNIHHSTTFG